MTGLRADLRAVREAQGFGLRELARRAGVDPGRLSKVERGLASPSPELLIRVGRVLGLRDVVRTLERFWPEGA